MEKIQKNTYFYITIETNENIKNVREKQSQNLSLQNDNHTKKIHWQSHIKPVTLST